jgi:hypothetical protein
MDYIKANELLQNRCKASKKMANNTYLQRRENDIAIMLHDTIVYRNNREEIRL